MPKHNGFRHQAYSADELNANWQTVRPAVSERESAAQSPRLTRWRSAGLDAVYLVHGTFTGDDALGLARHIERYSSAWARFGRRVGKNWADRLSADVGNYPVDYQRRLATLLNDQPRIGADVVDFPPRSLPVRRFDWSSENLHTGRAIAAIELLDRLRVGCEDGEHHVVLWGHSHAGNVFAMVTNLLGSESSQREKLFAALDRCVTHRNRTPPTLTARSRLHDAVSTVRPWLADGRSDSLRLSIVTFGTPVRYGWETRGYQRLMHIVHHRPVPGRAESRAKFPLSIEEIASAQYGDAVQQLGIAGTDFFPPWLPRGLRQTERRLTDLLQAGQSRTQLWSNLRLGVRVPAEGRTLLIDYPDDPPRLRQKLWGHAIYTTTAWLAFHAECIAAEWFRP